MWALSRSSASSSTGESSAAVQNAIPAKKAACWSAGTSSPRSRATRTARTYSATARASRAKTPGSNQPGTSSILALHEGPGSARTGVMASVRRAAPAAHRHLTRRS